MDEPLFVERGANHSNPPVHHVRWRDHIYARRCVDERLFLEYRKRLIVKHIA
ncbi:hypothetical protein D3C83_282650 [compost metagenome]